MSDFITYAMTDAHILVVLGKQLRQMRLNMGYSQADLAIASGLTRRTISAIESGKSTSTGNVIAILRSLRQFDVLSALNTPAPISPIAFIKAGKIPQRARSKIANKKNESVEW